MLVASLVLRIQHFTCKHPTSSPFSRPEDKETVTSSRPDMAGSTSQSVLYYCLHLFTYPQQPSQPKAGQRGCAHCHPQPPAPCAVPTPTAPANQAHCPPLVPPSIRCSATTCTQGGARCHMHWCTLQPGSVASTPSCSASALLPHSWRPGSCGPRGPADRPAVAAVRPKRGRAAHGRPASFPPGGCTRCAAGCTPCPGGTP
jgi:hypothetical protein